MRLAPLRGNATVDQIVALGRRMFEESRFARLGFDVDRAVGYANRLLTDPIYVGWGTFVGGEMVGMITGICGATLPFTSAIVANQHLLYVAPEHRASWFGLKLAMRFIQEAKAGGARDISFSNGTGYAPERVGRLFEICGLERVGGLYVMEV